MNETFDPMSLKAPEQYTAAEALAWAAGYRAALQPKPMEWPIIDENMIPVKGEEAL